MEILYDGIGATKDIHTEKEFLEIMKREFTDKNWEEAYRKTPIEVQFQLDRQLDYKNWNLPKDFVKFTLDDWLDYSDAIKSTKILYTGIGATKDLHTKEEFLEIMKKEFTERNWGEAYKINPKRVKFQLSYKNWNLPEDFVKFTLEDWLGYSGAGEANS
jgi:hypothetical protein